MKLYSLRIYRCMRSDASAKNQREKENPLEGRYSHAKSVLQDTITAVRDAILPKKDQVSVIYKWYMADKNGSFGVNEMLLHYSGMEMYNSGK